MSGRYDFDIPVTFRHRIRFTKDAFAEENPVIADLLEADRERKVIVHRERDRPLVSRPAGPDPFLSRRTDEPEAYRDRDYGRRGGLQDQQDADHGRHRSHRAQWD